MVTHLELDRQRQVDPCECKAIQGYIVRLRLKKRKEKRFTVFAEDMSLVSSIHMVARNNL